MENSKPAAPAVGMGCTLILYTDRHPYTVVEVPSPTRIIIQRDTAIRTDKNGQSDSQTYRYERNPDGEKLIVTLRKDGRWKVLKAGQVVALGHREQHYDFSF
jgi:hypothetical protein